MDNLPILRLKPKADARHLRHGFPWVYENEAVMDRRTRAIAAGSLAVLQDTNHETIGLVGFNAQSKIVGRILDRDPNAVLDNGWFEQKIRTALTHRVTLYDSPHYRLIHAEADGMPGVIIDRFGDTFVVQPNAAWADARIDLIVAALQSVASAKTVLLNGTGRARSLEGLEEIRKPVLGEFPTLPLAIPMNGATYFADLQDGQKTGLFYDQRPNHAFAQTLAKDAEVLDLFCHVGGFGLAARAAGAASVTCVDGSAAALKLAEMGASATPSGTSFEVSKSDAFAALEAYGVEGRRFGLVVCDPPAFAPSKSALERGLRAYERVARLSAPLVKPGGYLGLCSCSHAATAEKFRAACIRGIGRAGRQAQLIYTGGAGPDHPQHPALGENSYLKTLFFRIL